MSLYQFTRVRRVGAPIHRLLPSTVFLEPQFSGAFSLGEGLLVVPFSIVSWLRNIALPLLDFPRGVLRSPTRTSIGRGNIHSQTTAETPQDRRRQSKDSRERRTTLRCKEFSDTGAGLLFFFCHFLFPSLSLVCFTGYLNRFVL